MAKGFEGGEALKKALTSEQQTALDRIAIVSLARMRNRAVASDNPDKGGTPFKTGEMRLSATVDGNSIGYTKEYAPHVEYGHRAGSGYVQGRKFLKRNRDIEEPIFIQAIKNSIKNQLKGKK